MSVPKRPAKKHQIALVAKRQRSELEECLSKHGRELAVKLGLSEEEFQADVDAMLDGPPDPDPLMELYNHLAEAAASLEIARRRGLL